MNSNPYDAPQAPVADYQPSPPSSESLGPPQRRPAGHGVRWFGGAWELFRRAPGLWIGIFVVMVAIMMAGGLVPFVGFLAQTVLTPILWAGLMVGCDAQRRGQPLEFAHLFAGFSDRAGQLLLAGVLYGVALLVIMLVAFVPTIGFAAGMAVFGGGGDGAQFLASEQGMLLFLLAMLVYLALIVPLVMAIWFAPALIMLDGVAAPAALLLSLRACLRNIVPFLVYGLVGLGFAIAATLPLLLGWLVLGPVLYITSYTAYRDIFFGDAG